MTKTLPEIMLKDIIELDAILEELVSKISKGYDNARTIGTGQHLNTLSKLLIKEALAETAQIVAREVVESMKTVATTRTHKLTIGQNEYARKQLNLTEKQIDDHNDYCEAWEEGYADATKKVLTHLQSLENELSDVLSK